MANSRSYKEGLFKRLEDPEHVAAYLYEDGNEEVFLLALRDVVQSAMGMSELARQTQLNRQGLYTLLSAQGNPQLANVRAILDSLGLKLTIEAKPIRKQAS
jgi:probable addiction module antidote protein